MPLMSDDSETQWDSEWVILGREEERTEPSLALALRHQGGHQPEGPLIQNTSSGEIYELVLGEGQSHCRAGGGCGKPIGYIELRLSGANPDGAISTHTEWFFAACCVNCHKWGLVKNYGDEGVQALVSKGWAKSSKRRWRCPSHADV